MAVLYNEPLSRHTTFHIGGIAEKFYIPENLEDLKNNILENKEFKILSGGSNMLINDKKRFSCIISMNKCCNEIIYMGNSYVYVGASVRIQKLINDLAKNNLGGFEFLYSLPALFGGIVYMNAGRGSDKKSISDFIERVYYLDDNAELREIEKDKCEFNYRESIFQKNNWVIIGAKIKCNLTTSEKSKKKINDRLMKCKKVQDMRYPNFGSVFCKSNSHIMRLIKIIYKIKLIFLKPRGVIYNNKTANWLINVNGTYEEAIMCINHCINIHKFFHKDCKVEVKIWE